MLNNYEITGRKLLLGTDSEVDFLFENRGNSNKKTMKKKLFFLFVLVLIVGLTGCQKQNEDAEYYIEYLNTTKDGIVKVAYEPQSTQRDELIKELLTVLWSDSGTVDYKKPVPNDVELMNYSMEGAMLTVWLDEDYNKINEVERALCCAAIVRTLTQIEGVDCVNFYIGDAQMTDAQGNLMGALYSDSFVENPGAQINSIQSTVLTLYFSNKTGDGLVAEKREVHYSSNKSLEKLIVDQLLKGPDTVGLKSAIPSGTKIVSVSLVDGTCYVNLDSNFKHQDYTVKEPIVIYSIVNSLSELSSINAVQISINGDTSGVYRDSYRLSEVYLRNLDYVTTLNAENSGSSETTQSTENTQSTESIQGTEEVEQTEATEEAIQVRKF